MSMSNWRFTVTGARQVMERFLFEYDPERYSFDQRSPRGSIISLLALRHFENRKDAAEFLKAEANRKFKGGICHAFAKITQIDSEYLDGLHSGESWGEEFKFGGRFDQGVADGIAIREALEKRQEQVA